MIPYESRSAVAETAFEYFQRIEHERIVLPTSYREKEWPLPVATREKAP